MGGTKEKGRSVILRRSPPCLIVWSKGRIWRSKASSCEGERTGVLDGGRGVGRSPWERKGKVKRK
jgi:hypothetical protein